MSFLTVQDPLIKELIKLLGLEDRKVRGFTLRCYVGEVVTVIVEELAEVPPGVEREGYFLSAKRDEYFLSKKPGTVEVTTIDQASRGEKEFVLEPGESHSDS